MPAIRVTSKEGELTSVRHFKATFLNGSWGNKFSRQSTKFPWKMNATGTQVKYTPRVTSVACLAKSLSADQRKEWLTCIS